MITPRSVFWVWTAGFCCWVGYWLWHYASACRFVALKTGPFDGHALACSWRVGDSVMGETEPVLMMLREIVLDMQIPLCALVVGLVAYWVVLRSQARVVR